MALTLPHASDAGGMIVCAGSDGQRNYELACGCASHEPQVQSLCQCCCSPDLNAAGRSGPSLRVAEGSCSDHHIGVTLGGTLRTPTPSFTEVAPAALPGGPISGLPDCGALRQIEGHWHYSGAPPGPASLCALPLRI